MQFYRLIRIIKKIAFVSMAAKRTSNWILLIIGNRNTASFDFLDETNCGSFNRPQLIKQSLRILYRCWRRMLDTQYVGDKFEMPVNHSGDRSEILVVDRSLKKPANDGTAVHFGTLVPLLKYPKTITKIKSPIQPCHQDHCRRYTIRNCKYKLCLIVILRVLYL